MRDRDGEGKQALHKTLQKVGTGENRIDVPRKLILTMYNVCINIAR